MDCILYVYSNMSRYISIRCNSDLSMFFPLQQVYTRRELNYTLFPSFLREWGKIRDWRRFMNIEMYAIPVELLKLLIVWNESWYEGSNLKFLDFSPQWNRGPANFIAMSESFAAIFRSSSRHPAPPRETRETQSSFSPTFLSLSKILLPNFDRSTKTNDTGKRIIKPHPF